MVLRILFYLVALTISAFAAEEPKPFTVEDVQRLLAQPDVKTADDLLQRLPEDLRTDPVLMYSSQSLQEASPQAPRAILFGKGGSYYGGGRDDLDRLFVAFNGDPKARNFDSFEMIQFRAKTGKFEFSKIQFKNGKRPLFISAPPECVRCHDHPGHPNWTAYAVWAGAFPSEDGFGQSGENEKKMYDDFYTKSRSTGRYRFLKLRTAEELTANNDPPTKRLANILQDESFISFPMEVQSTRNFLAYRHLLQAAIKRCANLESFVPPDLLKRFAKPYAQVLKETEEEEKAAYLAREANAYRLSKTWRTTLDTTHSINFSLRDVPETAGVRWVMERDGASISPWFYTFETKDWSQPRSLFSSMSYRLTSVADYRYSTAYDCDQLRKDSLHDLGELLAKDRDPLSTGLKQTTIVGNRNANQPIMAEGDLSSAKGIIEVSCVKCHRDAKLAPLIALDDFGKLAAQLRRPPVGKTSVQPDLYREWLDRLQARDDRRMPPDSALTPAQTAVMKRYLDEILTAGR